MLTNEYGFAKDHHPMTTEIFNYIRQLDLKNGHYFDFKSGGDGDNGEFLMDLIDSFFQDVDVVITKKDKSKDRTENKKLNTIHSFIKDGFKIIRDRNVITLSSEEVSEFRYLETALSGRNTIELALEDRCVFKEDIVNQMMENTDICYEVETEFLDQIFSDEGDYEYEISKRYYDKIALENNEEQLY